MGRSRGKAAIINLLDRLTRFFGSTLRREILDALQGSRWNFASHRFFAYTPGGHHGSCFFNFFSRVPMVRITIQIWPQNRPFKRLGGRLAGLYLELENGGYLQRESEREKSLPLDQRDPWLLRLEQSKPLLEQIKSQIQRARSDALPKSVLTKACNYTLTLWTRLSRFLEHCELELSNNLAENAMRPLALGRRYEQLGIRQSLRSYEAK
jgi:hypothetical protein